MKLRRAPAGGLGKGAAVRTTRTAARSSADEPDDRATETEDSPPPEEIEKATTAAPRLLTRGRPAREILRMTRPG